MNIDQDANNHTTQKIVSSLSKFLTAYVNFSGLTKEGSANFYSSIFEGLIFNILTASSYQMSMDEKQLLVSKIIAYDPQKAPITGISDILDVATNKLSSKYPQILHDQVLIIMNKLLEGNRQNFSLEQVTLLEGFVKDLNAKKTAN